MTTARPETSDGKRKLSPEHRQKVAAAARARYEAMTPAEREAMTSRIGRKPKAAGGVPAKPAIADPPKEPPGRRSPLAMTPLEAIRALRGRG